MKGFPIRRKVMKRFEIRRKMMKGFSVLWMHRKLVQAVGRSGCRGSGVKKPELKRNAMF
jgi:hypothetical protein